MRALWLHAFFTAERPSWWTKHNLRRRGIAAFAQERKLAPVVGCALPLADSFVAAFTKWVTATMSGFPQELGYTWSGSFWSEGCGTLTACYLRGRGGGPDLPARAAVDVVRSL